MNGPIGPRTALGFLVVAGAILVAACVAPAAGGPTPTGVTFATPTATVTSEPTSGTTPVPELCAASQLAGRITLWEGAAGSRIAHISVTNTGGAACELSERLKPQLLDGHGAVLVDGTIVGVAATVAPGSTVSTLAEVSNYCGAAPVAPVTIGLVLTGRDRLSLTPPSATGVTGVPPCLGPTAPGHMEMRPWIS